MIGRFFALALALAAAPAAAQKPQAVPAPAAAPPAAATGDAAMFTHAASGAVFPRRIGEQSISETRDLNSPYDTVVDYAGADPRESTTLYIFRAAYPDARLWFDQVLAAMGTRIPLNIFEAGPDQPLRAFGSSAENALQKVYTTTQPGPFRSTSLLVAQAGEWIVKMYATSPTLDRAGLAARITAFAEAIRFPQATRFGEVAAPLQTCPAPQLGGRPAQPNEQRLAVAIGAGAALLRRSREPLPNGGAGWCRIAGTPSNPPVMGYRRSDGTGGWFILLGHAGRAFSAVTAGELGLTGESTATVAVTTPSFVRVAGVYDGLPDPMATLNQVAPVLQGQGGLISYENGEVVIGSAQPAQPAQPQKR